MLIILVLSSMSTQEDQMRSRRNGPLEVYYNNPYKFTGPSRKTTSELGLPLVDLIDDAQETIDFALYGMRNQPDVYKALVRAKARGVVIRGVVDMNADGTNTFKDTKKLFDLVDSLQTDYNWELIASINENRPKESNAYWSVPEGFEGTPQMVGYYLGDEEAIISVQASIEPSVYKGSIMHDKFFVVDHQKVWTGSANVTDTDTGGYNANVACVINNKQVAAAYTAEFEQMYLDGKFHQEKEVLAQEAVDIRVDTDTFVTVLFSPQQTPITNNFIPMIQAAKKNIKISAFYLTHKGMAGELIKAKERGVQVEIILDSIGASSGYTKHEILRVAGIPVKVENFGGMMHMKSMIIDDEILVVGSVNFTQSGDVRSDENTLIIKGDYYAKEASVFFDELWDAIPDKYLTFDPPAESKYSVNSMSDGIDNDYDGLIDIFDNPNPDMIVHPPYQIVKLEDGNNLIKGITVNEDAKVYLLPNDESYYDKVLEKYQVVYFPSVDEAKAAGYLPYNFNKYNLN